MVPPLLVRLLVRRVCVAVGFLADTAQRRQSFFHRGIPHATGIQRVLQVPRQPAGLTRVSTVMTVSLVMVVIMTMTMTMTRDARRFGDLNGASRLVVLLLLRPRFLLFRLRRVEVDPTKPGSLALMQAITKKGKTYHNGQVPDTLTSHGSTHSGWNLWLQGRTRRSWPLMKSSVQIGHEKLPVVSGAACLLADGAVLFRFSSADASSGAAAGWVIS